MTGQTREMMKDVMKQSVLISRFPREVLTTITKERTSYFPANPIQAMRKRFCASALGLVLLGFVNTGLSANWYVDNAAPGSNNGASWANAWTAFSSIVWGGSGVKPGDTLYISGGNTSQAYASALTIGASGTSGSPITIRVGQDSGHNGTVIFNATYIYCPQSYITIDGSVSGVSHLTITNVADSANKDNGYAVTSYASTISGITIRYVSISMCNNGLGFQYVNGYEFDHNSFLHILGDHGIKTIQSTENGWGVGSIHNNTFIYSGQYPGPDGIQSGSSVNIYSNRFEDVGGTDPIAPGQHPDWIQMAGNYCKIYDNEFINDGDSCIDFDCWAIRSPHDIWIYNNVFRYNSKNTDSTPDAIRIYSSNGTGPTSLVNWRILNNTFVDNPNWDGVSFGHYFTWGNPGGSGNEFKNNLFYNCGSGSSFRALLIVAGSGWTLDGNTYYYPSSAGAWVSIFGATEVASSWVAANEAHGKTNQPVFVSYTAYSDANDFHLSASDMGARNSGLNLSSYFTMDKDGNARPASGAWDIGAYQYPVSGPSTNPVISVSTRTLNFGPVAAGGSATNTFTVQNAGGGTLSGPVAVASVSTNFLTILSGGTYSLGAGQSQIVTVRYSPTGAPTDSGSIMCSGGAGAQVSVTGSLLAVLPGFSFPSYAGIIAAPFVTNNGGYVSQSVQTSVTNGGSAVYAVVITNSGSYTVSANVNAPGDGANSFYVNIDALPSDPTMIWDIPVASGFTNQPVSWRGNGTDTTAQYAPEVFNLTAGVHQLIIVGREAGAQLGQITIAPYIASRPSPPAPPGNLQIVPSP